MKPGGTAVFCRGFGLWKSFLCLNVFACECVFFLWPVNVTSLTVAAVFCELAPANFTLGGLFLPDNGELKATRLTSELNRSSKACFKSKTTSMSSLFTFNCAIIPGAAFVFETCSPPSRAARLRIGFTTQHC